jgi:hypothetical protein
LIDFSAAFQQLRTNSTSMSENAHNAQLTNSGNVSISNSGSFEVQWTKSKTNRIAANVDLYMDLLELKLHQFSIKKRKLLLRGKSFLWK